jgi:hypothetical protein
VQGIFPPEGKEKAQGLKALIAVFFTARLKSCPDTKHEFFRSLQSRALIQSITAVITERLEESMKRPKYGSSAQLSLRG